MIIGITGTFASGKDTVADILVKKGFEHHTCSEIIRAEANRRHMSTDRESLQEIGNILRREHGSHYLVDQIIKKAQSDKLVIAGIRQPGEVTYLKSFPNSLMIAVDAPIELRFKRLKSRGRNGDPTTLKEMQELENKEMYAEDHAVQNIAEAMKLADYTIINDSDRKALESKVESILQRAGI